MPQSESSVSLRLADIEDAASISAIYNPYVESSFVTFEQLRVDPEEMARRVHDVGSKDFPWYVAVEADSLVGFAHATPWKSRSAYRFSAEVTVYVAPGNARRGIGTRLQTAVLTALRQAGFHTAIAGIALPNPASVALHKQLGFQKVAHLSQVGFKMLRWVDVGYWQLIFTPQGD